MIGPQTLRHFLNQSDVRQKLIPTGMLAFSRASSGRLVGLTLCSHWLLKVFFSILLMGRCDNKGFGFATINNN